MSGAGLQTTAAPAAGGLLAPLRRLRATLTRASLVRRLVLLAGAWSVAVLLAAGLALSVFFSDAVTARFDDNLAVTVDSLLAGAQVENGLITAPVGIDPPSSRVDSGFYWEIATAEAAGPDQLVRSRSLFDRAIPLPRGGLPLLAAREGEVLTYDAAGPAGETLRVAAIQGHLDGVAHPVIFMVAQDRGPLDRDVRRFDTTIAVALLLLGVGLISAVFIQVRVGLAPLFALRREVAAVRVGDRERIVGAYPSELQPLAAELNGLMAHTQEVVERQRTHVGNLAHALKTPLSVILTESRQQPGPLADIVTRQAQTMGQQVDHHLRRARAAARAQGQGERTAVAPILEDLARTLDKIFQDKVEHVEWECGEELFFRGERQDLLEIAGNVMENACKWCAHRVRVDAGPDPARPGAFRLTVEDDGPGLAPDQRQTVLRRGARLDERTPGSGLGLSIVDELVRAYGGALDLTASSLGGLKVEIRLPGAEG